MRTAFLMMTTAMAATAAAAQDEPFALDPVVLGSALRDDRAILDTPVAASVRESEELEARQANDFEELIGDIPGVTIDGGPRGISQEPNIRGFRDEQIVLRFDGGRLTFNQAHRGRFFIDPDIVERVEVVRGGGSTLFGSGALGGVISVETKDADDLLEPGRDFGARVRGGFATNGDIAQGSVTLFGRSGAVDGLAFFGLRDFGTDLEDGSGDAIRNSQIDVVNGLLKFGFEPSAEQRFELSLSRYDDDGTTPANSTSPSGGDGDVERDARVTTARLSWDYAPVDSDLIDLSVLLYGNDLEITEDRIAPSRADVTRYETLGFEAVNRSRLDLGRPVTLVYGVEAIRDTQEGTRDGADRVQFPDAEATTIGVFAEATIALTDQFDLIPGIRFDSYSRDPDDPTLASADEEFVSPRLGFSYRPNERWQIFGNVARAFRAPSLTELYNDGVHFPGPFPAGPIRPGVNFGGVNVFVPNPDLEPEKSTQVELGTRLEDTSVLRPGDRLSFSVNAYYADVEDFIDQNVRIIDFNTATPGPGGVTVNGSTTSRNVDAQLWGIEAEVDYDADSWFAGAGLSLPRGEDQDGNALGSLPQDRVNLELGFRPGAGWEVGGRATFAFERDNLPENSPDADAYQVLDLFATWAPRSGPLEGAVFRAGVDNVLDEDYQIYPNALSQAGRSFKLSASFTF